MSRGLWFVAGAGAGAYVVVRARRAAEILTVDGVRDRVKGLSLGLRLLRDEVAQGSAERETELRVRYGLLPNESPALAPGAGASRPATSEHGSGEEEN